MLSGIMVVFENVSTQTMEKLLLKGYRKMMPKTIYEQFCLEKNGARLILYTSGKLLLQGKEDAIESVLSDLKRVGVTHPDPQLHFRNETGWIIGSDESLKGDTF